MKNYISLLSLIILSNIALSQGTAYEQGMKKAFSLWGENKTTEASALFERIALAEKENWLPYYYAANVLIASSFTTEDKVKTNEMLKKAEEHIAAAHVASPDNSEITTLEGVLYTGYVAMEPEVYAMQYSNKIMGLHEKALKLNPDNPRARFNKIEYEIGTARFFGQDLSTFCDALKETKPLFENPEKGDAFFPSYGVERLDATMTQCGCE